MSMRILIADDNKDAAESLAILMSLGDHEVMVVRDGSAAVDAMREWEPDIAVLDLDMPLMNGFAAALAIREIRPAVLLIALSGFLDEANRVRAKAVGFDLCVVKGTSYRDFRLQLLDLVRARRSDLLDRFE